MNVLHASMEEVVIGENEFNNKEDQLNLARIFIDIESNFGELVVTQLTLTRIFNHDQLDIVDQQNSIKMFVEYHHQGLRMKSCQALPNRVMLNMLPFMNYNFIKTKAK